MSTPNEGPERRGLTPWTPGDVDGAARSLSALSPREQQALGRVIRVAASVGPIINGVARGIRAIRNTMTRLSQFAQRLAGTDRALNQAQGGRHRAEQSRGLSMPTRESVVQARDAAVSLARDAGLSMARGAARGIAAGGRWAWSKGREGLSAANQWAQVQAVRAENWVNEKAEPVQQWVDEKLAPVEQWVDDKVDKSAAWVGDKYDRSAAFVNHQISKGAAKASAALAGLAAARMDPTLSPDQKLQKPELVMAQLAADYFASPEEQRPAKAAALAAYIENNYDTKQTGVPQQTAEGRQAVAGDRNLEASQAMASALTGVAPPSGIHSPTAPAGQESAATGEQKPGQHRKQEGPGQSGPSRD
ncbi:hypothetical protein BWI15_16725 [Kribbella sp. ALI-6-A]|uniref:hypothetical protein n=1 Tax=Kribbella sp. ALI-6-A TaxID=1933817 RepID=UPI00097C9B2E|nr:hypothetical protein [Kribbella sp. ALI-6-A]ONI71779.1 hypothetical protein BWI15_16725 [Kribbella sp. ALI-6-A]